MTKETMDVLASRSGSVYWDTLPWIKLSSFFYPEWSKTVCTELTFQTQTWTKLLDLWEHCIIVHERVDWEEYFVLADISTGNINVLKESGTKPTWAKRYEESRLPYKTYEIVRTEQINQDNLKTLRSKLGVQINEHFSANNFQAIPAELESMLQSSKKILDGCGKLCNEMMNLNAGNNNNTSPLSMGILFGMAFVWLSDEDKKAVSDYFGINNADECLAWFEGLYDYAKKIAWSTEFSFGVANAGAWVNGDNMKTALQDFDFELIGMDQSAINAWVSRKTKGMITELNTNGVVKLLMNAIALKANREKEFPKEETRVDDFVKSDGSTEKVNMMHRKMEVRILNISDGQILELPYKGGAKMYIGLPGEWVPLTAMENMGSHLVALKGATPQKADVYLPRFEFESSYGFASLFDAHPALANILNSFWWFDAVLQKTYVRTDEQWSKAAALTAALTRSISMDPFFYANRPFAYQIVWPDDKVLFAGQVNKPGLVS